MQLLSISGRDDLAPMQAFVDRYDLGGLFPHLADLDGRLWSRFGVSGQPAWAFVDDSGEFTTTFGAVSDPQLEAALEDLAAS